MAWPAGTAAADNLKTVLAAWLQARFAEPTIKSRLPNRHIAVAAPVSTRRNAGSIRVLLYTGADETLPHEYPTAAGRVLEEYHRVTLDVQANEKGAKADEVTKVVSVIKSLLASPTGRATLTDAGIYNARASAQDLEIDGVEFSRPISFQCHTDKLL